MVNIGKWTRSILMPEIGELNGEIKATDTKVESLEKNMNIRFDAVDISLGAVETNMETRFEAMETKIGALEKVTNSRFNQLEGKIDLILVKVDSARKFAEIEERLSKLETRN